MNRFKRVLSVFALSLLAGTLLVGFQNCGQVSMVGFGQQSKSGGGNGDSYGGMSGTFYYLKGNFKCSRAGAIDQVHSRLFIDSAKRTAYHEDECTQVRREVQIDSIRALWGQNIVTYDGKMFEYFQDIYSGGWVRPLKAFCVSDINWDRPNDPRRVDVLLKEPSDGSVEGIRTVSVLSSSSLLPIGFIDRTNQCPITEILASTYAEYSDPVLDWKIFSLPTTGLERTGTFRENNARTDINFSPTSIFCRFQQ